MFAAAMVATFFLCLPIEVRKPALPSVQEGLAAFQAEASDENTERKYGHLPIGLCHVMGGASVIASHLGGEPKLMREEGGRKSMAMNNLVVLIFRKVDFAGFCSVEKTAKSIH